MQEILLTIIVYAFYQWVYNARQTNYQSSQPVITSGLPMNPDYEPVDYNKHPMECTAYTSDEEEYAFRNDTELAEETMMRCNVESQPSPDLNTLATLGIRELKKLASSYKIRGYGKMPKAQVLASLYAVLDAQPVCLRA